MKKNISKINDWENFIELAYTHGVFPLVYHTLKEFPTLISSNVLQKLKLINLDIAKQNMMMTAELIKVTKLLEQNGIEVISFKGPTLSQMAYGDITLRQYVDLDILIKKDQIEKSIKLLKDCNYLTDIDLSIINSELFFELSKDISFYHSKSNISLEIHFDLFEKRFFHIDKNIKSLIWNSDERIKVNNNFLNTLKSELYIIYLIIHGSKHYWERIEWLNDVYKLLSKKDEIDYFKIVEIATKFKSKRMLLVSLSILSKVFNLDLPNNIEKQIENDYSINTIGLEMISLWNTSSNTKYINIKEILFIYKMQDNLILKIKVLYKLLFQIKIYDLKFVKLPKKIMFLYYFIRPFRIIFQLINKK